MEIGGVICVRQIMSSSAADVHEYYSPACLYDAFLLLSYYVWLFCS